MKIIPPNILFKKFSSGKDTYFMLYRLDLNTVRSFNCFQLTPGYEKQFLTLYQLLTIGTTGLNDLKQINEALKYFNK